MAVRTGEPSFVTPLQTGEVECDMAAVEERAPAVPLPIGGAWSGPQRRLTVGLTLMVTCTALEALAVATTMPATVRDLGGLSLYGWAFSAFMLTNLVGITLAGDEADRRGPARPLAMGIALFTIGLLIAGTAPAMLVVVAGRAVQTDRDLSDAPLTTRSLPSCCSTVRYCVHYRRAHASWWLA